MIPLHQLSTEIRSCQKCSLHKNNINYVIGKGSQTPEYVFVGEAAGLQEAKQGIPFVGPSGKLLTKWIDSFGLTEQQYAVVNVLKCFPRDGDSPRKPTDMEIDCCKDWLQKQIQLLKPKKLVAVGSTALKELCGVDKIMSAAGKTFQAKPEYFSLPTLALLHPAFYLRNGKTTDSIIQNAVFFFGKTIDQSTEKVAILDIETTSENIAQAQIVRIGIKTLWNNQTHLLHTAVEAKRILDQATHVVGFNTENYDFPVLERHKFFTHRTKVCVDLYQAITARGKREALGLNALYDDRMDTFCEHLKLGKKIEFDYSILKRQRTQEEEQQLDRYLSNDLDMTEALYKWMENYLISLPKMMKPEDVWKKAYLTETTGITAYKVICNLANLPEVYGNEEKDSTIEGGYVSPPKRTETRGRIRCLDVNSSYPHAFMHFNLSHRATPQTQNVAKANPLFPELQGQYDGDSFGPISKIIQQMYADRVRLKKEKKPEQYGLKIILNTMYGITEKPAFVSVCNRTAAADCTYIGRQVVKYLTKRFEEMGYESLYNDTDSNYFIDPYNDDEKIKQNAKLVAEEIKQNVPFPQETFGFDLDHKIRYLRFFTADETTILKKNYLFVTEDNKLVIKGLAVKKRSTPLLAKKVFEEYIQPKIIQTLSCDFKKDEIKQVIHNYLRNDITLAGRRFSVKPYEEYKSKTCTSAQIAKQYGNGIYFLIPNTKIGIGVGKKFCTVEEAKRLNFHDIDLSTVWSALEKFIKPDTVQSKLLLYEGVA